MEELDHRKLIQDLLKEHARDLGRAEAIETQLFFDTENNHYQLLYVGWNGEKRVYACPIHVDLKMEKSGFNKMEKSGFNAILRK